MASTAAAAARRNIKLSWLDLRGSGLSAIERLCLEEALLRHDPQERCWAILGTHEPTTNRYLTTPSQSSSHVAACSNPNASCLVVMGIGGKPNELLNVDLVRDDGVMVIKRFSGGGTVVLDHSSVWTTFIGRTKHMTHVDPYPRNIMKWSGDDVFGPAFARLKQEAQLLGTEHSNPKATKQQQQRTLVMDRKSGGDNSGQAVTVPLLRRKSSEAHDCITEIPDFSLQENDYVLGERKVGGNAQSIIKGGWLHHTSFLWDYVDDHMDYLSLPKKRPEYRGDRSHDDFLVKLDTYFGHVGKRSFFSAIKEACVDKYQVEDVTLPEALQLVNDEVGGLQKWFDGKCRTRIVDL